MPKFEHDTGKMTNTGNFISKDGIYYVRVEDAKRDDIHYSGGVFQKYSVDMVVRTDIEQEERGKTVKGDITKPQEKWLTPNDLAWGGWNSKIISKYAIGAGLDKSEEEIQNIAQLAKLLIGKNLKIEVQRQEAKNGNLYARVVDVFPLDENDTPPEATTAPDLDYSINTEEDENLPF